METRHKTRFPFDRNATVELHDSKMFRGIGYSENKSIAQYFPLVNEAQAAVLVLRPPADSKNNKLEAMVTWYFASLTLSTRRADSDLAGNREIPRVYKKYISFVTACFLEYSFFTYCRYCSQRKSHFYGRVVLHHISPGVRRV